MDASILAAVALVVLGVIALRIGWRAPRGRWTAPAGWTAIGAGALLLTVREGAWGLAVAGLAGSAAGFALLTAAWLASQREVRRDERVPQAVRRAALAEAAGTRLLSRLSVFLLVTFGAFAASAAAGLAVQALGRAAGWREADSNAAGLLVFPIVWAVLVTVMMLGRGPGAMWRPLAATLAVSAGLVWLAI